MHQRKNELSTIFEAGPAKVPAEDWGDMRVAIVSVPAGTDFALLLKGHPDNLCPSPHWGYVIKGRLKIEYPDGEETIRAGDVCYTPPGHTGVAEEDTEFWKFHRRINCAVQYQSIVAVSSNT